MAHLALYRKYRPKTFDKLIGQDHIVKTLVNQIEEDKVGHAYLFTGTRGTGKTSTAKMFARALNCQMPINGCACGKCATCVALEDPSNLDILEMDAASNNGVEEIRSLREKISYPPTVGKYKVYIIDEVHMLTPSAFNALLKTLEEPPKHAVFILATTEVQKVPATILSRCMRFDFRLVPTNDIVKLIKEVYDNEGKEYDDDAIRLIAKSGEGSVRDALSIADTCMSFERGRLTYKSVLDVLGSTDYSSVLTIVKSMIECNGGAVIDEIEKLLLLGKQPGLLLFDIISCIRDLLITKTCKNPNAILGVPDDKMEEIMKVSICTTTENLIRALEILTKLDNEMRYTSNQKVVLETALLKASRPDSDYSIDALLTRVKNLEEKLEKGVTIEKKTELLSLKDVDVNRFAGELYKRLRSASYSMLWQVIQKAKISIDGNNLVLTFSDEQTQKVVDVAQINTIKELFSDYHPFEVILVSDSEKGNDERYNRAIEELRQNFGSERIIEKQSKKEN